MHGGGGDGCGGVGLASSFVTDDVVSPLTRNVVVEM